MKRLILTAIVAATLTPSLATADEELKWAAEGYYRTRAVFLTNMAAAPTVTLPYPVNGEDFRNPEIRRTSYLTHSLRLMPQVAYGELVALKAQIDGFRDVLWGDNNGLFAAPLFATDGSNQGLFGTDQNRFYGQQEGLSLNLSRAWIEFKAKVGMMRVGRMPSHWGMGILANGGGTGNIDPTTKNKRNKRPARDNFFDDDFGDNHFGLTADRILFITKPLTVYKTIKKAANVESHLIVGYAFDKITEAPLLFAEPFSRRFRPFGQQGFISDNGPDDINEHVVLVVWSNPELDIVAETDQLTAGVYGVMRQSGATSTFSSDLDPTENCGEFEGDLIPCVDTGSKVFIADFWYKLRLGPFYSEAEILTIRGKSFGGIPFPSPNRKRKAAINSGVFRLGHITEKWDGIFEIGHASGDDRLEDETFKQRPMHADYNVGLILYEEVLRELSARAYGTPFFSVENPNGAVGFFSNGGVINSTYINPKGHFRLNKPEKDMKIELVGGLLLAWIDELADGVGMFAPGTDKFLGTEIDVGVKGHFHGGKLLFSLETGVLFYGGALKTVYPLADTSFTLQSRVAFVF